MTERVFSVNGGLESLIALGFKEQGDISGVCYVLEPSASLWDGLLKGKKMLENEIGTLSSTPSLPRMPAPTPAPPMPTGMGSNNPLSNPMMQQILNNPSMMQSMMNNPMMQQMANANPQLAQTFNMLRANPGMMQQALSAMQNNPQMMQQISQMMQQGQPGSMGNMGNMGNMMNQMQSMLGSQSQGQNAGNTASVNSNNNNGRNDAQMTEEEMLAEAIQRSLQEQ